MKMVKTQIDLDGELNLGLVSDMFNRPDISKNERGKLDKRIYIVSILKKYIESRKNKLLSKYYIELTREEINHLITIIKISIEVMKKDIFFGKNDIIVAKRIENKIMRQLK